MNEQPDLYFLKVREVRSRFYGGDPTYEAQILRRRFQGSAVWSVHARSRGHTTRDAATAAGLKLADRRKLKVESDPRKVRQAEFRDRYGDD